MKSVYIIDDSQVMIDLLKNMIELYGDFIVMGATCYAGNIENHIDELDDVPDIFIVDLIMPDIDGISLIKKLRDRYPDSLILVVTAVMDKDIIDDAFNAGANDYLMKPFTIKELESKLKSLAGKND